MQQTINLLQPELLPKREVVRFNQTLIAAGVFALVLVCVSLWDMWVTRADQAQLVRLQQELSVLTASNNDLKLRASATPDPDLRRAVSQLGQRERDERELAQVLISLDLGQGFSTYLDDLSRVHVPGLWLQQIQLDAGGREVALRGYSYTAEKVPVFLQRLSDGAGFRGRVFDHLELEAQQDGSLAFLIRGPDTDASL